MPFLASEGCFWPLTASMTSEIKNNYTCVIKTRHFQQIHWRNFFCGMYGFAAKSSIARLNTLRLLIRYVMRVHKDFKLIVVKFFLRTNTISSVGYTGGSFSEDVFISSHLKICLIAWPSQNIWTLVHIFNFWA